MVKEFYEFKCFNCGTEMEFTPSIAMQEGHNAGHGQCYHCKEMFILAIAEDGQTGISEPMPDELKDLKEH